VPSVSPSGLGRIERVGADEVARAGMLRTTNVEPGRYFCM